MNNSNESLINSFVNEANELLGELERNLLAFEKEPSNYELINNIFRAMHTLKGSSAMFGFENIQNIAHEYETIYGLVRDKKMPVASELISITLRGVDAIQNILLNKVSNNSIDGLMKDIKLVSLSGGTTQTIEQRRATVRQEKIYGIIFDPAPEIFERGIIPEHTLQEIEGNGIAIIKRHNKELSGEQQLMEKVCSNTWEIFLSSTLSALNIENIFMFYTEDEFSVTEITGNEISEETKFFHYLNNIYQDVESVKAQVSTSIDELHALENISKPKKNETESVEIIGNDNHFIKDTTNNKNENVAWLNISSTKIDELLNIVSELVTSTSAMQNHAERLTDLKLIESIESINKLIKQFRINTLELRLIPINTLLVKFKRQVRDLSMELGKKVELIIETQDTEIDKTILKAIENPLLHIIRNSIDHGIEFPEERRKLGKDTTGIIKITSFYSGAYVIIQVQDDGRGINFEKVRTKAIEKGYIERNQKVNEQELLSFLMESGFSTADDISLISGRGVGMDVVKKELSKVKGSLELDTEKGLGTSITLKLPVTLSIVDTLMIEVMGANYLLPLLEVEYCYNDASQAIYNQEKSCLQYKGNLIPYISLRKKFNYQNNTSGNEMVIVINKFEKRFALIVDKVIGEQQTVIKNLGEVFINQPYFSGGNIMSDGKIALILDTNHLFNQLYLN